MKIPQDELFKQQVHTLSLKWNCEDCALFCVKTKSCSHGFPVKRHLKARYQNPEADLLFCKDFELV